MISEEQNIHHKSFKRRLLSIGARIASFFIALGSRLLHGSCRITFIGVDSARAISDAGGASIAPFWHCCFPGVAYFFRDKNYLTIISASRDGDFADGMIKSLGYRSFRGSPGKGGARAVAKMIAAFRQSPSGGFVADGSQGPARIAQKGIIALSLHSGVPIYPVGMAAHPCWRLPSWDRTIIAKPFSRFVIIMGEPITIERGSTPEMIEQYRIRLENELNTLCETAELAAKGHVAQNVESVKIKSFRKLLGRMEKHHPEQGK